MKTRVLAIFGVGILMALDASAAGGEAMSGGTSGKIRDWMRTSFDESNGCPAGYPLDCHNNHCCPAGATLYCPQMEPTPCFNPDDLTDEQLKILNDHCSPLLKCS